MLRDSRFGILRAILGGGVTVEAMVLDWDLAEYPASAAAKSGFFPVRNALAIQAFASSEPTLQKALFP